MNLKRLKLRYSFISRVVAGEYIFFPSGSASAILRGFLLVTSSGYRLMKALESETDLHSLVNIITDNYDVSAETAEEDTIKFLGKLAKHGLLEERQ